MVLGGGGRNGSNPAAMADHDMPALGFFGCGFATKVSHVEVAHSGGHGLYLSGGMVSPSRVVAWNNAGAGVKTSGGYRGVLDELFVHVPGGEVGSAGVVTEGFWRHGESGADESVYRTHPMLFHATIVASPVPYTPPTPPPTTPLPNWVGSDGYGTLDGTDRSVTAWQGSAGCQGSSTYIALPAGCEIAQDTPEARDVIMNHPWGTAVVATAGNCYGGSNYHQPGTQFGSTSCLRSRETDGVTEYSVSQCALRILIYCGPPPPTPTPPALVQIARGSGATVGNTVVIPSTERSVAFSVDDCSSSLRVGHFSDADPAAPAYVSNDAVSIDDRVVLAGFGDDPPTRVSDYRNFNGAWSRRVTDSSPTPFTLGAGCEGAPLWRTHRAPPQFTSGAFVLNASSAVHATSSGPRLDPRATAAMVAAAALDPVPTHIVDAVATRRDPRSRWMLDSFFHRPNATNKPHPGAFGPDEPFPWFARVDASAGFVARTGGATITPLTRSEAEPGYAALGVYADDSCGSSGGRLGELAVRRGACYEVPEWIEDGDSPIARLLPAAMHSNRIAPGSQPDDVFDRLQVMWTNAKSSLYTYEENPAVDPEDLTKARRSKFRGAVFADGKVVFVPYKSWAVGVYDLSTNLLSFESMMVGTNGFNEGDYHFRYGALASNGKVVLAPYMANGVGVFDPSAPPGERFEFEHFRVQVPSTDSGGRLFSGAALANNGKVVFAPYSADAVGMFDPSAPPEDPKRFEYESFNRADLETLIGASQSFNGATTASNGKVIFTPFDADAVGVFDPSDNSLELVDISAPSASVDLGDLSSFTVGDKFSGAALAHNGKVIFAPYTAKGVGVFDPSDNSFVLVDISAHSPPSVNLGFRSSDGLVMSAKFSDTVAASDGKIVFAPLFGTLGSVNSVGVFDPSDNSFQLEGISHITDTNKAFNGAAVSDDGRIFFAPYDSDAVGVYSRGAAHTKYLSNKPHVMHRTKLTANDAAELDEFGRSVSIDGDTMVAGANGDDDPVKGSNSGSAYVFTRDTPGDVASGWTQVAKLTANDGAANDKSGYSVAVDGDTIVIGAHLNYNDGTRGGSVYVFTRDTPGYLASGWTQIAKLTASDGAELDYLGEKVAFDGDTIVAAASRDDDQGSNSGSVYVFTRDIPGYLASGWTEVAKLTAHDAAENLYFGSSLSIDSDTLVVGTTRGSGGNGTAYVFIRDTAGDLTSGWTEITNLNASDGEAGDQFGSSVSIDGDTIVVGAYGDDTDKGGSSGSVYVFIRDIFGDITSGWTEIAKLTASDGVGMDWFGSSVTIDGDTMVIGAKYDDDKGGNSGSAYVFTRDTPGDLTSGWTQVFKLSDGYWNDYFGYSVAIDGDTIAVGAYKDDDDGSDSGSVHVYSLSPIPCPAASHDTASSVDPSEPPRYMRFDVDAATVSVYEGSDAHNACLAAAEPSLTIATPTTPSPPPRFGDCACACDGNPVANGTINVTDDHGGVGVSSGECAAAGPEECGDMVTDGVIDACPGGVDFTAVWSYVPTYTGANFTYDHGDCECLCETAVVGDGGCSGEVGVPEWCHINVTGDISGKGVPEDACSVHGPGACDIFANYFLAANISHLFPQCNGTNFTTKWSYNSTYTGGVWSDDEDSNDENSTGLQGCEVVCEGHGYGQSQCEDIVGCQYDDGECWSAVGANPCDSGPTGRRLLTASSGTRSTSGLTGRRLLTASSGTGTRSTCGKIGNSYVSITDADVAAGSMNSENRVIMTEWRGAGYCDDDVAPLWTFMDATSTLTESDIYERDVLGAARVAAPAAEARCYRDSGDSIRLTCLPDGVLSVLSFFCADGCGADDAANEVRTGEHLLVDVTSERGEVCDAAAGAAPRIVSSCGGLAVAQSFSGALATAAGPFGSFRGYRAPMESLRETHPLWVGARGPGAKNVTAAKAENEMLASLGYETTPALNHLCLDSTDREAMGWTKHSPSTNDGYISIATDDPKSWCAGHDYVSLECPRNDDTLHVWCANADQLDGAARKPSGECRGEPSNYHCPGLPRPERFVWNGIDLGGAYRASLYKRGYFAELIPTPCDASGPVANGGLGGCADPLPHGESCEPTCNSGSSLSGRRTCHDGRLIDTAKCVKPCDASGSIANGVAGECGGVLAHGA